MPCCRKACARSSKSSTRLPRRTSGLLMKLALARRLMAIPPLAVGHVRRAQGETRDRLVAQQRPGYRCGTARSGLAFLHGAVEDNLTSLVNSRDASLRERARRVVPGGMWGHQNAANLPEGYPQSFALGEGCRIWDVDGNEYIDFMCSWGPIVLGHNHPEVDAAARRQAEQGDLLNGPGEVMVELAEAAVHQVPPAPWVQFPKNGHTPTTASVTIP